MIPRFRAWHKTWKEMGKVTCIHFDDKQSVISMFCEEEQASSALLDDEVILMQSTGLKDKNGQEIFEGDILKFNDEWEDYCQEGYVDGSSEGINYVLIGSEMTYFIFEKTKYPDSSLFYYVNEEHLTFQEVMEDNEFEFEIVGNIYENPELLEVTE